MINNQKIILIEKLKQIQDHKLGCTQKFNNQNYRAALDQRENDKKKRVRRTAQEINRPFACPKPNCRKNYGSEGSLAQHIKLKHQQSTDEAKTSPKKKILLKYQL